MIGMDGWSFAAMIFKMFWWVLPIFALIKVLQSAWFKGKMGELFVRRLLARHLDLTVYREFSNVTLPSNDGTTQIDHIYVSPFGIFVIETKNFSGWIFGSIKQATWTQSIYRKKFKFQNPLRQNYKHTKTLESLLNVPQSALISIVVFTGDCEFKSGIPDGVCVLGNLVEFIKSHHIKIFSESEISEISDKIEAARLEPSFRVNRDHVRHIKQKNKIC